MIASALVVLAAVITVLAICNWRKKGVWRAQIQEQADELGMALFYDSGSRSLQPLTVDDPNRAQVSLARQEIFYPRIPFKELLAGGHPGVMSSSANFSTVPETVYPSAAPLRLVGADTDPELGIEQLLNAHESDGVANQTEAQGKGSLGTPDSFDDMLFRPASKGELNTSDPRRVDRPVEPRDALEYTG